MQPDYSLLLIALVSAAAKHEGHTCLGFEVRPGGLIACPCGVAFEVGRPALASEEAA